MADIRRRNYKLFQFLAQNMTDAELRTMLECVEDELNFRQEYEEHRHLRGRRTVEPLPPIEEEREEERAEVQPSALSGLEARPIRRTVPPPPPEGEETAREAFRERRARRKHPPPDRPAPREKRDKPATLRG